MLLTNWDMAEWYTSWNISIMVSGSNPPLILFLLGDATVGQIVRIGGRK